LDNPDSSPDDYKYWSDRLSEAVTKNPYNKDLVLTLAGYDARVDIDKPIERVETFVKLKNKNRQRDNAYAEALYHLACYKYRKINDSEIGPESDPVKEVISILRKAIGLRPEIHQWKDNDPEGDFNRLKSLDLFIKL
jgi:hypothetical protein